jgi:RNA polymerase sigma-70 factor (ECF subfamily)
MTDVLLGDAQAQDATVRLAARGDETAFARLVQEHHAAMARVAYVIGGDAEVARDAVQSAWSIAWRRLPSLRDPSQVRAWLIAIAANEARASLRRGRRGGGTVNLDDALEVLGGHDPADRIAVVDLRRVLARLDTDERTLLALRYTAGLESAEIASHLGISASGVRTRLARLLERLRSELDRG